MGCFIKSQADRMEPNIATEFSTLNKLSRNSRFCNFDNREAHSPILTVMECKY